MCKNIGCNNSDSPKQDVNDKNINEKAVDSLHYRATNEVILQTLVVNVHGVKRERKARAIIDTVSQKSYILRSTAEELGFNLQREEEFCHYLFDVSRYIDKKDANMIIVTLLSQADIHVFSLWDLELLGIRYPIEQNSREETEKAVMFHFLETVRQKVDGRYEVQIP
ncbi:hypothetical protein CDAR_310321 [Caerostris darwini]|uniref:Uncharacterized protein n=1 Tax=Caerostris darwini TaxID=1538125 RepID=A0AAV4SI45_9ARAC|nr:hypothetical protein CDAR_310321 [Caerostris darwini]